MAFIARVVITVFALAMLVELGHPKNQAEAAQAVSEQVVSLEQGISAQAEKMAKLDADIKAFKQSRNNQQ